MAVIRQANLLGQQRLDVPHVRAIESAVAGDFDVLAGQMLSGEQAVILNGFRLSTSTAGGAATDLKLQVAGGMMMHFNASESGTVFSVPADRADEELTSTNVKVIGSFTANQTNYIGIDFRRAADSTTADLVQFIDPTTGKETSATVPLARTLDYRIYISTTNFDQTLNICPVAKVVTDPSNNVSSITDARQMMFRLATGGTSPSASYVYPWAQGRNETTAVDGWSGGDKAIGSMKEWQDAVMTRLWELGGGEYWYANAADRNVTMIGNGSTFSNGEYFVWTLGTNTLQWQNLRFLFDNSTANYNSVVNGTAVLADGDCVYVDLNRSTTNPAVDTVTPVKGTLATLGTSTIPGNRYVMAWRNGNNVYTRGWRYAVGTTFTPATTTSTGVVQLNNTPGSASNPSVVSIMSNGQAEVTATLNNSHAIKGTGVGTGVGVWAVAGSNKKAFLADGGTSVIKSNENQTTLGRNAVSALQLVQEYTSAYNRRYEIQFYSGAVATGNVISGIASEYTSFDATNGTGGDLLFWTKKSTDANPSERVRIDSSGKVTINAPFSGNALEVAGSSIFKTAAASTSTSVYSTGLDNSGGFVADRYFSTGTLTAGDVLGSLTFAGQNTALSGSAAQVAGEVDALGGSRIKGRLLFRTSDGTNNAERMRIDSSGNVGVGVSPSYKLHVQDSVAGVVSSAVRNASASSSAYAAFRTGNDVDFESGLVRNSSTNTGYAGTNSLNLWQQNAYPIGISTNNLLRMSVSGAGNVTINAPTSGLALDALGSARIGGTATTNYSLLTVVGDMAIQQNQPLLNLVSANGGTRFGYLYHFGASSGDIQLLNQVTGGGIRLGTNSVDRVTLSSAGNVTINAPTSGNALTVSGVVASTDNLYAETGGNAVSSAYRIRPPAWGMLNNSQFGNSVSVVAPPGTPPRVPFGGANFANALNMTATATSGSEGFSAIPAGTYQMSLQGFFQLGVPGFTSGAAYTFTFYGTYFSLFGVTNATSTPASAWNAYAYRPTAGNWATSDVGYISTTVPITFTSTGSLYVVVSGPVNTSHTVTFFTTFSLNRLN